MQSPAQLVSVLITSYGDTELLDYTRRSVLAQEDWAVEVLAPTPTLGPAAARNVALREASGEWIAFLDEGDVWLPDRLRRQLGDPAAADAPLAYAGRVVADRTGRLLEYVLAPDPTELAAQLRLFNPLGSPAGVLVRVEALRTVGGFDERLALLGPWRAWIELLEQGRAAVCAELLLVELSRRATPALRAPRRTLAELRLLAREGLIDAHTPLRAGMGLAQELRRLGRRREAAALYLRGALRHGRPQDALRATSALLRRTPEYEPPDFMAPAWLPQPPEAR